MNSDNQTFQLIQGGFKEVPGEEYSRNTFVRPSATWHVRQFDTVRQALRAVLDARVSPTKSVEAACHLDLEILEEHEFPSPTEFQEDSHDMLQAGLQKCPEFVLPACIKINDVNLFLATFPHLANAVPVMLAHQGVQPYTHGEPASATPIEVPPYDSISKNRWRSAYWTPRGHRPLIPLWHH
jgi:hypothetical protein